MEEVFKIWKDKRNPNGRGRSKGSLWEVSNLGRIRKNGVIVDGHIHKKTGYVYIGYGGGDDILHRAVATLFIDNPENKPQVDHIDGNKQNNCVDNLRWVTSSENKLNPNTNKALHRKRHIITERNTGRKWMNDGDQNYFVDQNEIQDKLNKGLVFGWISGSKNASKTGRCYKWMNDGENDFYVEQTDISNKLQQGLTFGRLLTRK